MNRATRRRERKQADNPDNQRSSVRGVVDAATQQQVNAVQQTLDIAVGYHNVGNVAQAETIYRQILNANPDHPVALHLLGVIAHQSGKNTEAEELISRAIKLKPGFAEAHSNLGLVLRALGRQADAIAQFRKALTLDPGFTGAQTNLDQTLKQKARRDGEMERFLGVIRALRPIVPPRELIRIGGAGDGGYLLPDDFDGVELCFSPGVGTLSNFENELADRGIRCFLADNSVDEPKGLHALCSFEKAFIGPFNDDETMTLEAWVEATCGDARPDAILQMDIEGNEYTSLLETPRSTLKMFRIIALELHFLDSVSDPWFLRLLEAMIRKLKEDFHVVHLHPNNCCGDFEHGGVVLPRVLECTFLRHDRFGQGEHRHASTFPHPLDEDNVPNKATLNLNPSFFSDTLGPNAG